MLITIIGINAKRAFIIYWIITKREKTVTAFYS
jgi:hypothetical protein